MKTKNIARIAMLTAMALVIFVIENQIPTLIPVPGVKLGLANTVTLFAVWTLGRKQAGVILFLRIILGSFVTGSVSAMIYSVSGAVLCYALMCLTRPVFTVRQIWVMSVLGAVAHNIGQTVAAILVTATVSVIAYLPLLLVSGVITGLFTGLCAQYATVHIRKSKGEAL